MRRKNSTNELIYFIYCLEFRDMCQINSFHPETEASLFGKRSMKLQFFENVYQPDKGQKRMSLNG